MDSIGLGTTDYTSIINETHQTELEKSLKSSKAADKSERPTDDELMDAAKQFETYMVEQIYKSMEKTIMKADDDENEYMRYFGDLRVQQYAQAVTDQGKLGLAQQLYEAMKNNYPDTTIKEEDAALAAEESGVVDSQ